MKFSPKTIISLLIIFFATPGLAQVKLNYSVSSPDKNTVVEIGVDNNQRLMYRLLLEKNEVLAWSLLGFISSDLNATEKLSITSKFQKSFNAEFVWPLGENDHIENRYNEFQIACSSGKKEFAVIGRVYNGSLAFRYRLPQQAKPVILLKEATEFNFPTSYLIYQYHQESVFTPANIDTLTATSDLPSTLTNGHYFLSVGEAMNNNYTKAELTRSGAGHGLSIRFVRDSSLLLSDFLTPWRTVSVSKTAIGLHNFSELNLKLNPPPPAGVPAWIKPGKLIRSQLTTQSGLDCINFAASHNLQYIMFDAGWYGAEFRGTSDPAVVIPQMDLPKIIGYGKEKGIGVILYVNYVGLRVKLDSLLPLYKKWGVAGLKFGFVDGLTQKGIIWLEDAIAKVNKAEFILDIHDNYKPTGLSRTYPVLLTQEGIRGDENSPDAFHTTTLPFTRFLAGAADFTFCYPNASNKYTKNLKVSMAQQLALTVIYFSPLQSMFWYGIPTEYTNEEEIEFFKLVPTVWNESHYLAGDIGKGVSVARRNGATWFVGNAAGLNNWKAVIKLDFLEKGKTYSGTMYEDDGKGSIRKKLFQAKHGDDFSIDLKATEGQAIIFKEK